eukprot:CAMPEP_0173396468 /NCGR_PEP_ID=MMETSP1356-20130122/35572_1 /TAXON_ID=77927 ORGANISM="Hemiselmis virescens, Strain PCC157" /NCGR_SAMPLE_ID=MMETSP1356 /ASSEMBLY_ACC=CAM_ASM_000847 /LENGTH=236 /DNA_ID=CAMNT_0014355511 /DNA_START=7 /DNA_END=717 /DNA_ORIENTATION=-
MAIEASHYTAALGILRRVLVWLKTTGRDAEGILDASALSNVCLRLLTYISKDLVYGSVEGSGLLAAHACECLTWLVAHGDSKILKMSASAQGMEKVVTRDQLGRAFLFHEIARVSEQGIFTKLSSHAAADAAKGGGMGEAAALLTNELASVTFVADHVTAAIIKWTEDNPNEVSPSPPMILSVVSASLASLTMDARTDLLNEPALRASAGRGEEDKVLRMLVEGYRGSVRVLPTAL